MAKGQSSTKTKKKRLVSRAKKSSQSICDVLAWASVAASCPLASAKARGEAKVPVFDLHTHSTCSDGKLSPVELVARACKNKVQVLALTDHDTMAGVPAAMEAAAKCGMRIIPGVEISALYQVSEEVVHILAYYGPLGPAKVAELDSVLLKIREGRFIRAETMLRKLKELKKPIRWERVLEIAGEGVAPGRCHLARALVEAGHVETEQQAFTKYLYDGGPAYCRGLEPPADEVVHLICRTGGVAVLAHPWCLKSPQPIIECLTDAGLHGMEVYRKEGKAVAFVPFCDSHQLLKLGGSDFHGRGDRYETPLGGVPLPAPVIDRFLKTAEPIWRAALRDILHDFANEKLESRDTEISAGDCWSISSIADVNGMEMMTVKNLAGLKLRLSPWLNAADVAWVRDEASDLSLCCENGMELLSA